jgi:hypothetical protein
MPAKRLPIVSTSRSLLEALKPLEPRILTRLREVHLPLVLGEPAVVVADTGSFDLAPGHVHDPLAGPHDCPPSASRTRIKAAS